jgi:hypothetical protein
VTKSLLLALILVSVQAAQLVEDNYDSILAPAYRKDQNVANVVFGSDKAYGVEHLKSSAALTTELKVSFID